MANYFRMWYAENNQNPILGSPPLGSCSGLTVTVLKSKAQHKRPGLHAGVTQEKGLGYVYPVSKDT